MLTLSGFRGAGCVSIYETTGNKPYSAGKGVSYVEAALLAGLPLPALWVVEVHSVSVVSLLSTRGLTIIRTATAPHGAWDGGKLGGEGFALAATGNRRSSSVTVQLSHSSM